MFFKNKKPDYAGNIAAQEVQMYRRERMLGVREEAQILMGSSMNDLHIARKEWYDEMLEKKAEVAKLDAEISLKAEFIQRIHEFEKMSKEFNRYKAEAEASERIINGLKGELDRADINLKMALEKPQIGRRFC